MLTLKEATIAAENFRGDKVLKVSDCGDKWFFTFEADKGKCGFVPLFVYKADGRLEQKFFGECFDLLLKAKPVPLLD